MNKEEAEGRLASIRWKIEGDMAIMVGKNLTDTYLALESLRTVGVPPISVKHATTDPEDDSHLVSVFKQNLLDKVSYAIIETGMTAPALQR